jgi:hypothetical protein
MKYWAEKIGTIRQTRIFRRQFISHSHTRNTLAIAKSQYPSGTTEQNDTHLFGAFSIHRVSPLRDGGADRSASTPRDQRAAQILSNVLFGEEGREEKMILNVNENEKINSRTNIDKTNRKSIFGKILVQ